MLASAAQNNYERLMSSPSGKFLYRLQIGCMCSNDHFQSYEKRMA